MAIARTGKINGNLKEALENVLNGPPIDFGLLRIVSAEKSGVIGICREYLTGALLKSTNETGLVALQTLCRTERGLYTILPTCEVADFVAVNQELHIPISEILHALEHNPQSPLLTSESSANPPAQHVSQPMPQQSAPQVAPAPQPIVLQAAPQQPQARPPAMPPGASLHAQTISGSQQATPPMGGFAVPPPPTGMLDKVIAIANAMSGRYKAVLPDEPVPGCDELLYDPNSIRKGQGILNQVLKHARQTLTRLRPVSAVEAEQAAQTQAHIPQTPYSGMPMAPAATAPQPDPELPANRPSLNSLMPKVRTAERTEPPAFSFESEPFPTAPTGENGSTFGTYAFDTDDLQAPIPPAPPRNTSQYQLPPAEPVRQAVKPSLTESVIVRANELFHEQIRQKTSGPLKTNPHIKSGVDRREFDISRNADNEPPPAAPEPQPSAWSKLIFWGKKEQE